MSLYYKGGLIDIYGNNYGLTAIEATGYPISVFERVKLADVDNKMYR